MLKILSILFVIPTAFIGCATGRHFDRDMSDPNYHGDIMPGPVAFTGAKDEAIPAAGVAALFSRGYYRPSSISGECRISDEGSPIPIPCRNVTVILMAKDNQELRRQQVDENGNFSFLVEQGQKYRVKVPDTKILSSFTSGEVEMGESLHLKLRSKTSSN